MSYLEKIIYLTRQQYETLLSNNNTGQVTYGGITLTGVQDNNIYFITDETVSAADLGDDFILPVSKGGTGKIQFTSGSLLVGNGQNALTEIGATDQNTYNTIVKRDSNGNFSAGTITATFSGTGSAITNINGSNIASGTVAFARLPTGTGASQVAIGNHNHDSTYYKLDGTNTGTQLRISTQSAAYTNQIQFMNSTTKKGSIGTDNNGVVGLYGASKIVLRPQLDASTTGVEVTTAAMHPTGSMTLGTSDKRWSTIYGSAININGSVTVSKANGNNDLGYILENTSKTKKVEFLIGGSSGNAGLFDRTKGKWIVHSDTTGKIYLNNISFSNQTANYILAGPSSGDNADSTFRRLVEADIPNLSASKINSGTFGIDRIPTITNAKLEHNSITIGGVTASLGDSITLDSLGITGAMHYRGAITADPTSTTPTGTYASGDVLVNSNNSKEFVYDGSSWREIGDESSYKVKQTAITSNTGTAGTTAVTNFLYSFSQDVNGVVSAQYRPLPVGTTSVTGIVRLGTGEADAMAGNTVVNKVKQTATTTNAAYKILLSTTSSMSSGTNYESYYSTTFTYNPNTGALAVGGTITSDGNDVLTTASDLAWNKLTGIPSASSTTAGITLLDATGGAATYEHTHSTTIAKTGTSQIALTASTTYTLTAGGTTVVFTTPADTKNVNYGSITTDGKVGTGNTLLKTVSGSVTSGPAITTGTTKFLREDGVFATPSYTTNTDKYVEQGLTTTSTYRKILLSYQNDSTTNATITTATNVVYSATGIAVRPSDNSLYVAGTIYSGGNAVLTAHGNSYGKVTVSIQSTATSTVTGNASAVTLESTTAHEALKFTTGNKWITATATNSGTAGSDEIKIGHIVGTITNSAPTSNQTGTRGSTFNIPKVTVDEAGHVTKQESITVSLPASDNTMGKTIIGSTSSTTSAITANQGDPYINFVEGTGTTPKSSFQLKAGTAVSITATSAGVITITSSDNDTKNTAGSSTTSTKIFLVGATTQSTSAQTYSNTSVYATDGTLSAAKFTVNYSTTAPADKVTLQWNDTDKALEFVFAPNI